MPRPTDPELLFALPGCNFPFEGVTLKIADSAVLGKALVAGPDREPGLPRVPAQPGARAAREPWPGGGKHAHTQACVSSVLACSCGATSAFWSFPFMLSSRETWIFIFKKMPFLLLFPDSAFVSLFSEVWLLIWSLVLPLGKCPPSPGRQHTTHSDEPQGALHGPRVSSSVAGDSRTVLEFLCWIL